MNLLNKSTCMQRLRHGLAVWRLSRSWKLAIAAALQEGVG